MSKFCFYVQMFVFIFKCAFFMFTYMFLCQINAFMSKRTFLCQNEGIMSKWRRVFSSKLLSDVISSRKYRETTTQRRRKHGENALRCAISLCVSKVNVACEIDFLKKIQGNCQPDVEKTRDMHTVVQFSLCFLE